MTGLVVAVVVGTGSSSSGPLLCAGTFCSAGYVPADNAQGAVQSPISSIDDACQLAQAVYQSGSDSNTTALVAVRTTDNRLNAALWDYGTRVSLGLSNSWEPMPVIESYCPAFGPQATTSTPAPDPQTAPATPSSSPATVRAVPGTAARVLSTGGGNMVYGVAGPSMERDASGELEVYPQLTTPVSVGSNVTIICAVYGQDVSPGGGLASTDLWDDTPVGWFSDSALRSIATNPAINACTGNLSRTSASSALPSPSFGPFPVYSGGTTVNVMTGANSVSNLVGQLNDGDLVTLVCTTTGDDVSSPDYLNGQPIGHSTQWDQISSPVQGWVPDALINSATMNSAAPTC